MPGTREPEICPDVAGNYASALHDVPVHDVMLLERLRQEAKAGRRYKLSPDQRARIIAAQRSTIYVYFIVADQLGLVKIGQSRTPMARLSTLQISSPAKLRIALAFLANPSTERTLHRVLSAHHSHGEWFRLTDQVLAVMDAAAEHGLAGVTAIIDGWKEIETKGVDPSDVQC